MFWYPFKYINIQDIWVMNWYHWLHIWQSHFIHIIEICSSTYCVFVKIIFYLKDGLCICILLELLVDSVCYKLNITPLIQLYSSLDVTTPMVSTLGNTASNVYWSWVLFLFIRRWSVVRPITVIVFARIIIFPIFPF